LLARLMLWLHTAFAWTVALVSMTVLSVCAGLTALFAKDPMRAWRRWSIAWARLALAAARVRVEIEDPERVRELLDRPVILACNHASTLDVPVLYGHIPGFFSFLSKIEVFRVPVLGWAAVFLGCIPLRRGDRVSAAEALVHAEEALKDRRSVLIFAEGTRTPDGKLGPYKRGAMVLAQRTGVPVLAMVIDGTYGLMPKGAVVGRPGTVTIKLGRLLPPPPPDAPVDEATAELHAEAQYLLDRPARLPESVPATLPARLA
jgi:1-acyl-sn-glycerol-3-phosphate acyltransferase